MRETENVVPPREEPSRRGSPLTLTEALRLVREGPGASARSLRVGLAAGAPALHLGSVLRAYATRAPLGASLEVVEGTYDDLVGNVSRSAGTGLDAVLVLLEWSDLDPRLGWRRAVRPAADEAADVARTVSATLSRLGEAVAAVAADSPVVVAGPTVPLPAAPWGREGEWNPARVTLERQLLEFRERLLALPRCAIVDDSAIAHVHPRERVALRSLTATGFPYPTEVASSLAAALLEAAFPPPPLKGIITDLDDTLWHGIVGDVGIDEVAWSLDAGAAHHGWYQRLLGQLAHSGVLIGVASKNEPAVAEAALARRDLLVDPAGLFPVVASWGPKSEAVARILAAWNVGADSVMFIDDNPLELEEVARSHPGILTRRFPAEQPEGVRALLEELHGRFSRRRVDADDLLRVRSLRAGAALAADRGSESTDETFLASLEGRIAIAFADRDGDERALALVNKTNQFNLNGRRAMESEWLALRRSPEGRIAVVSYEDRFGPLGRIAVVAGRVQADRFEVEWWVMSCRAFSRRIEHHVTRALFESLDVASLTLHVAHTDRNAPLLRFLTELVGAEPGPGPLVLERGTVLDRIGPTFHQVELASLPIVPIP